MYKFSLKRHLLRLQIINGKNVYFYTKIFYIHRLLLQYKPHKTRMIINNKFNKCHNISVYVREFEKSRHATASRGELHTIFLVIKRDAKLDHVS